MNTSDNVVEDAFGTRPNLHIVLELGQSTHLNVGGGVRARLQAGFCAVHSTRFVVGTGLLTLPCLVFFSFLQVHFECQMRLDMRLKQTGPSI